ncbi:MAG: hypothetical protein JETCAE03_36610 [Ignavibacteriaceae bacterium]|uniref:hypothetical protein n=1 Tax=Ignavibacterium album TaxID=591197 RepID=UPI00208857C9|nr:hypothetical protein [Ignavibacterium album]MBI5660769.1 hypothetical protein [Ignavibacterium album]GJQ44163.1 MAG: hypothetical protein JETCAE03_36610 [Ignavibacteriaceae bacterium]
MFRIITLCVFLFFHFEITAQQYYGWATGYSGKILNTTNGGTNWSSQSSGTTNDLYSVSFINSSTGWTSVGQEKSLRQPMVVQIG